MSLQNSLNSLRIKGFRAFGELDIPRLSNVTLIVGKNSVGKTSVLEALRLYFTEGDRHAISQLLTSRDEFVYRREENLESVEGYDLALQSLFHGRPSFKAGLPRFSIGPMGADESSKTVSVAMTYLRRETDETDGSVRLRRLNPDELDIYPEAMLGFRISVGQKGLLVPLSRSSLRVQRATTPELPPRAFYLSSTGLAPKDLAQQWDAIALTDDEQLVVDALGTMSDPVERLALVESRSGRERIMMGKTPRFNEPVPFKSLGDGINHILGIMLALIQARSGCLLADEIENGIHYSKQAELWRLIFRQAAKGSTQVIATTHSWDCVLGFQIAAMEQQELSASLIRLEGDSNGVRAVIFNPSEIRIANDQSIEIR